MKGGSINAREEKYDVQNIHSGATWQQDGSPHHTVLTSEYPLQQNLKVWGSDLLLLSAISFYFPPSMGSDLQPPSQPQLGLCYPIANFTEVGNYCTQWTETLQKFSRGPKPLLLAMNFGRMATETRTDSNEFDWLENPMIHIPLPCLNRSSCEIRREEPNSWSTQGRGMSQIWRSCMFLIRILTGSELISWR